MRNTCSRAPRRFGAFGPLLGAVALMIGGCSAAPRSPQAISASDAWATGDEPLGSAVAAPRGGRLEITLDDTSAQDASGSSEDEAIAKKLNNPVANLISFPIQYNYDAGLGANGRGHKTTINIQPVIPIPINEDWNLISRTILPIIDQKDVVSGSGSQGGVGDITQSLFFSPVKPTEGGWIWGAGPAFLIPTANDDLLGPNKWGAGPTGVLLKQEGPWTYGALANHIWSFAGSSNSPDVNATYMQPFCAYTTAEQWTYTLNSESTYDWEAKRWSIPFNFLVSRLVRLGKLPVSIGAGVRYWAQAPDCGPEGIGYRVVFTPIFPR